MKALTIFPGKGDIQLKNIPEPAISDDNEIKIEVIQVGICGTDREEVAGGRADAPEGENELVIGHEMFGRVTEVGPAVKSVKPGDFGLFTVRRGCTICVPCQMMRNDMCNTGLYLERGIKGLNGYECEYVIDKEDYFINVPAEIKSVGVLTEPMSVAEKAVDEALKLQALRIPGFDETAWIRSARVLIAGIGSIGLLAAFALRLRGAEIYGLDIVDEDSLRPQILKSIDGNYIDGRKVSADDIDDKCGEMDFIFDATGIAKLEFQLLDALGVNGIYVLTGIPSGDRPVSLLGDEIIRRIVLDNQVMLGSVNAGINHYKMAVEDLKKAKEKWGDKIDKIITGRINYEDYKRAFASHNPDEIKTILEWKKL
jgi:threonine dehydrogenase-like Zn-dependent dehydrogenase